MSAHVLGKELMKSPKIYAFEFVREYVLKGVTPYTSQGKLTHNQECKLN